MALVGLNDFAKRQTAESPFSHYTKSEEDLLSLVTQCFHLGKEGYKPGVMLVPVPPANFRCGVINITSETSLRAVYEARRPGEAAFLSVLATGEKNQAEKATIALYSRAVLAEGNEATTDCDWEIVNISAQDQWEEEPMDPMTMARNFLELEGGTKGDFSANDFAQAIIYWSTRAKVDPVVPKSKLVWEYCECGCHGHEASYFGLNFWLFNNLGSRGDASKPDTFYLHAGHGRCAPLIGRYSSWVEAQAAALDKCK